MTLAKAIGERISVSLLSIAAANKKMPAPAIVNINTKTTESFPAGIARAFVRGLRASEYLSALRLKAIAVERAPTIAIAIHRSCAKLGRPRAANTVPIQAHGYAISESSLLIISCDE